MKDAGKKLLIKLWKSLLWAGFPEKLLAFDSLLPLKLLEGVVAVVGIGRGGWCGWDE